MSCIWVCNFLPTVISTRRQRYIYWETKIKTHLGTGLESKAGKSSTYGAGQGSTLPLQRCSIAVVWITLEKIRWELLCDVRGAAAPSQLLLLLCKQARGFCSCWIFQLLRFFHFWWLNTEHSHSSEWRTRVNSLPKAATRDFPYLFKYIQTSQVPQLECPSQLQSYHLGFIHYP